MWRLRGIPLYVKNRLNFNSSINRKLNNNNNIIKHNRKQSKNYDNIFISSVLLLSSVTLYSYYNNNNSLNNSPFYSYCAASESEYITRNFVADAVEIASPAVVNIITSVEMYMMSAASAGSGFIISKDGFIVTNAHVVNKSTDGKVWITMWNGNSIAII